MTHEEAVLISAYTGFLFVDNFSEVHKLIEETLGRPVLTHELASKNLQELVRAELKPKLKTIVQE